MTTSKPIPIRDFDINKLIITTPEKIGIYDRSAVGYKGHYDKPVLELKGHKYLPDTEYTYVMSGWMPCYGVYPTYAFNPILLQQKKPQVRNDTTLNGYQVIVPLTSEESATKPTPDEQVNINFFLQLREAIAQHMIDNKDKLPDNFSNVSDEKMINMVNPLITRAKTDDPKSGKKAEDPTKPYHLYMPMMFYKADPTKNKLRADKFGTHFYGPGNIEVSPLTYVKKFGQIQMLMRVRYVSYGKKANLIFQLVEANYKPRESYVYTRRLEANPFTAEDIEEPHVGDEKQEDKLDEKYVSDAKPPSEYNPNDEDEHNDEHSDEPEPMKTIKTKDGKIKQIPMSEYNKLKSKQKA